MLMVILLCMMHVNLDVNVIKLLVEGGSDVSIKNKKGQTSKDVATEYDQPDAIAFLSK